MTFQRHNSDNAKLSKLFLIHQHKLVISVTQYVSHSTHQGFKPYIWSVDGRLRNPSSELRKGEVLENLSFPNLFGLQTDE